MTETVLPGDLYIVKVPFVDGKGAKPRPVLVTSLPNGKGDVLGLPGTSRLDQWQEPHQVVIQPDDLAHGHLPLATVFPTSKQMVFSPRLFAAYVGRIKPDCLDTMLRQIVAGRVSDYNAIQRAPSPFQPG